MLKSINSYLQNFISDRILEIDDKVVHKNKKFKEFLEESSDLCSEIIDILPHVSKKLMLKYGEKRNQMETLSMLIIYKQGLADGLKMGNITNKLRDRDIKKLFPEDMNYFK